MACSSTLPSKATIHILLVEHAPDHVEQIRTALSSWDRLVELAVARTLGDARARLAISSPDLAIIDLQLPDGRGVELLPPSREEMTYPVMIMTSWGNEKEAVSAMRAGALDYLVKSAATFADMPRIVERALREWGHIAERRRAEETLRESERNYRLLFENMTAGFALHEMLYDEQGEPSDYRFLEVNPAFERLTGIAASTVIGKTVREVLPGTEQYWIDVFGKVAKTGEPTNYDNYSRELGRYYDTWAFSPARDRFAVVFTDITERRLAEEALRESEVLFRSFFNSSAIGMAIISPEGRFLQANPANCQRLGYTEEEMQHLSVADITHPDDRAESGQVYEELRSGRVRSTEYERRYLRKDGLVLWGRVTIAGIYDAQQNLQYIVGQMQDITEKKQAEEALRASEERWRSVFTTAAAGMVILSHEGHILQANPAMCSLLGYPDEELLELTIEEVTHPDDRDRTSLHYGEIFAGQREVLHYEKRYLRKDGQTVWGHASVACVMDADLQPLYCVGLVQDITERVRMEEAIRKANRELDDFVQMVSHDLRTPLTPIIGYTELLQVMYRDQLDEQATEYLAEIGRQGQRMLRLLEDLLSLARTGYLPPPAEPVDSSQVLQEALVGLASRLANAGMRVETGLLPCLRVPKTVLLQVFDNLIGNAIRYAGPGGSIEVEGVRRGARVTFSVRDHGPGVPEEERDRIFDLFYRSSTWKEVEGTGVGLATVQKIARLYGGRAWVEESPGGGSTFRVEMVDAAGQEAD